MYPKNITDVNETPDRHNWYTKFLVHSCRWMAAFVGTGLAYNTPPDAPTVLGEEKTLEGRKKI